MISARTDSASHDATTVTEPLWVRVLMWTGFPLLGAALGWALKSVSGWVTSLPWAPMQGPFQLVERFIAEFGEPRTTLVALAVGIVAGLVLAFIADQERLTVTVGRERVSLRRGDDSQEIEPASISAVFLDRKELVVLGRFGDELTRERSDLDPNRLEDAFRSHGFTWLDGDPYRDEFRLWVEEMPDLTPSVNALMRARSRALRKDGDEGREDARELRKELARLGIVVREEKKRQYWRKVGE